VAFIEGDGIMATKRGRLMIFCVLLLLCGGFFFGGVADVTPNAGAGPAPGSADMRSAPSDTTTYDRALVPGEGPTPSGAAPSGAGPLGVIGGPCIFPNIGVVDAVVNNTNANLTNTDTRGDSEMNIAVNPMDPMEIVMSAFSGGWSGAASTAPLYHTTDGGQTWSQVGVPPPPGWVNTSCPCDWSWDWAQDGSLAGTILAQFPAGVGVDVVSVTTMDATSSAAYAYNGNPAQRTNTLLATSYDNVDQPWLLINRTPGNAALDNVYVAYDDFNNSDGVSGVDMRVAVSSNVSPLNFTTDVQVGNAAGGVNPGLRLADNRANGVMWAIWGRNPGAGSGGSKNMNYMLNRSTDGGATWTLNGDPNLPTTAGIIVANADSTQPQPKFGTVNALLGGVHHAAVDPGTGDLYYVYGNRDSVTNNNRLAIRRVTDAGGGMVSVGAENFVTGQVQAAIPSVAVLDNGTVGVFYYTFDGMSMGFPQFTAHFSISRDQGVTWTDQVLVQFLSSATDNANTRQRVLGDYMQVKALGECFYGSFTANGAAFGRATANHDPIFFFTCAPAVSVECPPDQNVECAIPQSLPFDVKEINGEAVAVTFKVDGVPVPGQTQVVPAGTVPATINFTFTYGGPPGTAHIVEATATNTSADVWTCTTTATTVDTIPPVVTTLLRRTLLWPARRGMVPVAYSANASDSCGLASFRVDVYSDEPNGAAPFTPDASDMGTAASLRLRMERAYPAGNGRVYLIIAVATDDGGNTTVQVRTATVPIIPTAFNILAVRMEALVAAAGVNPVTGAPPASHANLIHSFTPPP